jgi:GT2 family glycosyltransferase
MTRLPVVAAIPNYNMGEQLEELLPSLMAAGYDDIYVLDDNSTDGSREATHAVSTDIRFVTDGENKGAGANRNRILGVLGHEATIHFLDADTSLDTERAAEVIADALPSDEFGFVGGLAKTKAGFQTVWNYGPRQSLYADAGANLQSYIEPLLEADPAKAARLRERFSKLLADWPDPQTHPVRRQVYWVVEQNMVVNSKTFKEIGGFDETLREHEIQDLAIRMAAKGLDRLFDPSFVTTHKEVDVRHYNRLLAMMKAEVKINRKHGLRNWLRPNGSFRPTL